MPKPDPDKDIIDPFVSLEIFGIPIDEQKMQTKAIKDNGIFLLNNGIIFLGFNPAWNETFSFPLYCPEMAILRVSVKDFGVISNDFIGEYSVPVNSIRAGNFYNFIKIFYRLFAYTSKHRTFAG